MQRRVTYWEKNKVTRITNDFSTNFGRSTCNCSSTRTVPSDSMSYGRRWNWYVDTPKLKGIGIREQLSGRWCVTNLPRGCQQSNEQIWYVDVTSSLWYNQNILRETHVQKRRSRIACWFMEIKNVLVHGGQRRLHVDGYDAETKTVYEFGCLFELAGKGFFFFFVVVKNGFDMFCNAVQVMLENTFAQLVDFVSSFKSLL